MRTASLFCSIAAEPRKRVELFTRSFVAICSHSGETGASISLSAVSRTPSVSFGGRRAGPPRRRDCAPAGSRAQPTALEGPCLDPPGRARRFSVQPLHPETQHGIAPCPQGLQSCLPAWALGRYRCRARPGCFTASVGSLPQSQPRQAHSRAAERPEGNAPSLLEWHSRPVTIRLAANVTDIYVGTPRRTALFVQSDRGESNTRLCVGSAGSDHQTAIAFTELPAGIAPARRPYKRRPALGQRSIGCAVPSRYRLRGHRRILLALPGAYRSM